MITAFLVGCVVHFAASRLHDDGKPAGFVRGMVHGAMMPMAMPNLIVGNDVPIYAEKNTGCSYKLGYTAGVNACGLLFFGFFFWRVNRWRKA